MLRSFVLTRRRCRGMVLLVGLVGVVFQLPAQDRDSKMRSDQGSASAWGGISPPPGDMIVGFYENDKVMVGLNHVYADSEKLSHRWRSFIPWMSPDIVSVFPYSEAIQTVPSRRPLFYVGHSAAWVSVTEHDSRSVHLVRADTKHNSREVQITSGWSAINFRPGFTDREEVPVKFHLVSENIYTIQPARPLEDGEYLVIFGPSALSGFEFQIACSSGHCD